MEFTVDEITYRTPEPLWGMGYDDAGISYGNIISERLAGPAAIRPMFNLIDDFAVDEHDQPLPIGFQKNATKMQFSRPSDDDYVASLSSPA